MSVVGACPALKMARRTDSACHAHILGATEREAIRVCRESCVYGRELAMSAEIPTRWAQPLPEFVPLEGDYGHLRAVRKELARVGINPVELLGTLIKKSRSQPLVKMRPALPVPAPIREPHLTPKTSPLHPGRPEDAMVKDFPTVPVTCEPAPARRKRGRPLGSKNAPKPAPAPVAAPRAAPIVSKFLIVPALAAAVASYPRQMKRARASILRKRYNNAAGSGHKYHSYNEFLRDLDLAGVCIVRDKYRVQDSWVVLDDAMRRLITTNQKRAA